MYFETEDILSGQPKQKYQFASLDEITSILNQLKVNQTIWSQKSLKQRLEVLLELKNQFNTHRDILALTITTEMGKPITESYAEVDKCISTMERLKDFDLSFLNHRIVDHNPVYKTAEISHEPLGVIYSIMPWNYPLWQVVRQFIPALLVGNTVLLKHSELVPETANLLTSMFKKSTDLSIFVNLFISHDDTEFVLSQDCVGGVSLTGSVPAGKTVNAIANKYFKKVVLELGGSDPYLVLDDANMDDAVSKIVQARLNVAGQTCIAAKRAIVHRSKLEEFLNKCKLEIEKYKIGSPFEKETKLGPLAHSKFKIKIQRQLSELKKNVATELIYSKPHGQSEKMAYCNPEIYLVKKSSAWLKDQEFFAPVLLVQPFDSDIEAVQLANDTVFALGAGIFSSNIERAKTLANQIVAGQVAINNFIKTDLEIPFGGRRYSGIGRELGKESFFEFTQVRVVSVG